MADGDSKYDYHLFISAVSDDFKELRGSIKKKLESDLRYRCLTQEDMGYDGLLTLEKLDKCIRRSAVVAHIVGANRGCKPRENSVKWLLEKYRKRINERCPGLAEMAERGDFYLTEWEAWLALLHDKPLLLYARKGEFKKTWTKREEYKNLVKKVEKLSKSRHQKFKDQDHLISLIEKSLASDTLKDRLDETSAFRWPPPPDFDTFAEGKRKGFTGRDWLFNRVEELLSQGQKQPLLICGAYGTGKSAFMAELASKIPDSVLAKYFCQFDQTSELHPGRIVGALARQIAVGINDYRNAIDENSALQDVLAAAYSDPVRAWRRGVAGPLREIRKPNQNWLLLIDSLDESAEFRLRDIPDARQTSDESQSVQQETLIDLIASSEAGNLPGWLRVVLTSRNVPELELDRLADRLTVIDLDRGDYERENKKDVAEYITRRVNAQLAVKLGADFEEKKDDFVELLMELSAGKFLFARHVLDEVNRDEFTGREFNKLHNFFLDVRVQLGSRIKSDVQFQTQRHGGVGAMGAFYGRVFKKRIGGYRLDKEAVRRVMAVIAVALKPLPAEAIAQVLGLKNRAKVDKIITAFGGLLKCDRTNNGITFDHFSIEQWLRGESEYGIVAAGKYMISKQATDNAFQQIAGTCAEILREKEKDEDKDPLANSEPLSDYLRTCGVQHLVGAKKLASALTLLKLLYGARSGSFDQTGLRPLADCVVNGINAALADSAFARDRAALQGIETDQLEFLLKYRDYETSKYEGVVRLVLEHDFDHWKELLENSDKTADWTRSPDIVFRNDSGGAIARILQAAHEEKEAVNVWVERLTTMVGDKNGDTREVAGYALKYLCLRRYGVKHRPWWTMLEKTVKSLMATLAGSACATDRMVAGEALLALAVQNESVIEWEELSAARLGGEPFNRFWNPYWGNHQADIDAIMVLYTVKNHSINIDDVEAVKAVKAIRVGRGIDAQCPQHEASNYLRKRIQEQGGFSNKLTGILLNEAAQQSCGEWELVQGDVIKDIEKALGDTNRRPYVVDLIRLIMLHPLWSETERGSNLLSKLIKRDSKSRWSLMKELLADGYDTHWRLRYGAIDAAYTAGAADDYQTFLALLVNFGKEEMHPRVRGICIDDLHAYSKDCGSEKRQEVLRKSEVGEVVRQWLSDADDVWLLEYLHTLFMHLAEVDSKLCSELYSSPKGGSLSPLLVFEDKPFYEVEYEKFMAEIEQRQSQLWAKSRGGETGLAAST